MALQGFCVPLSPEGRASLTPMPPWHYVGDMLLVDFWADPSAVAAVLPPRLEPDLQDPGRCTAFFVAWQFASQQADEPQDPVRSQYHEFILLVNATLDNEAVSSCPYIYVDSDVSMARGWIQGWPKKLGAVHTTRSFGLRSPAAPLVESGGSFGGSLSVNGRRLAEATVSLERPSQDPLFLGKRPIVNVRHFPQLAAAQQGRAAVHELVRSVLSGVSRSEIWEGAATLQFHDAPDQELYALRPRRVGRGYRYTTALTVDDLEIVAPLIDEPDEVPA